MSSIVYRAINKQLINPPSFLRDNLHYEVMMGSIAYGTSNDNSDCDIYGWCIPPKEVVFPHLAGHIHKFDKIQEFDQFQQHHIIDKEANKEYDFSIYNIVNYFKLCLDNNPNMIDSLFVPRRCILHISQIGEMVREERKSFIHKGAWHRFKGYAYSQLHKMEGKQAEGKRKELIEKYGYDIKFGCHTVRLLLECEMILAEGDIDLERHREQLKSIRRGEWKKEEIIKWASEKELQLEKLYHESKLPYTADFQKIKHLLLKCLEHHYGSLEKVIVNPNKEKIILQQIKELMSKI